MFFGELQHFYKMKNNKVILKLREHHISWAKQARFYWNKHALIYANNKNGVRRQALDLEMLLQLKISNKRLLGGLNVNIEYRSRLVPQFIERGWFQKWTPTCIWKVLHSHFNFDCLKAIRKEGTDLFRDIDNFLDSRLQVNQ